MRLKRPRYWRHAIHFCGWDRTCRSVHADWYLNLNFLVGADGFPVRINLSPPWVRRANDRWADSLVWQEVRRPNGCTCPDRWNCPLHGDPGMG